MIGSLTPLQRKIGLAVSLALVIAGCALIGYTYGREQGTSDVAKGPSEVAIRGELVCLPHKEIGGIQTMECAFGFLSDEGSYYALRDTDTSYKNLTTAPNGEPVMVKGALTSDIDDKYQGVGTIEVTEIIGLAGL